MNTGSERDTQMNAQEGAGEMLPSVMYGLAFPFWEKMGFHINDLCHTREQDGPACPFISLSAHTLVCAVRAIELERVRSYADPSPTTVEQLLDGAVDTLPRLISCLNNMQEKDGQSAAQELARDLQEILTSLHEHLVDWQYPTVGLADLAKDDFASTVKHLAGSTAVCNGIAIGKKKPAEAKDNEGIDVLEKCLLGLRHLHGCVRKCSRDSLRDHIQRIPKVGLDGVASRDADEDRFERKLRERVHDIAVDSRLWPQAVLESLGASKQKPRKTQTRRRRKGS